MDIEKVENKKDVVKITTKDDTQSVFSLIKTFLQENKEVVSSGVFKKHHLIDETSFFLKSKKDNGLEVLKKELKKIKKDLNSLKIK